MSESDAVQRPGGKYAVGVMLSAFGVFWIGEGLGIAWPGADVAILLFAAAFGLLGLGMIRVLRIGREMAV